MPYTGKGPVTNNSHIMLQYSPKVKTRKRLQMLSMSQMRFHHHQDMMRMNKEHYFPSFIATNEIKELTSQKATRKLLREYKVCNYFENH